MTNKQPDESVIDAGRPISPERTCVVRIQKRAKSVVAQEREWMPGIGGLL